MSPSLERLLEKSFDYAGLFPPAGLAMPRAVELYARYITTNADWLVGRFVCPVNRLSELLEALEADGTADVEETGPWPIAVLGSSLDRLKADLNILDSLGEAMADWIDPEVFEVKADGKVDRGALRELANAPFEECYVELAWGDGMQESMHQLAEFDVIGAKTRMGGVAASAYPPSEPVALFLQEAINLDLTFKLTAGLHHPIRFFDPTVQADSHGFLNVLCAGCLAFVNDLSQREIVRILDERDPGAFWFKDRALGWRDFEATLDEIDGFRGLFSSIGSCSIEEPLSDMQVLSLVGAGN